MNTMSQLLHEKKQILEHNLKEMEEVLVAFSSGVDSAFLLKTAHDVLGDRATAVTARGDFFPEMETEESIAFCKDHNIRQILIDVDPLCNPDIAGNPPDRCYLCKSMIFRRFREVAEDQKILFLADGTNADDEGDYRPGLRALKELRISSPLKDAGLTKQEIRLLSREAGLSTWNKPSYACLASRLVYGEKITKEKLQMVEKAEQVLMGLGFSQIRVRIHGPVARIEVEKQDIERFLDPEIRAQVSTKLHQLGFLYVALDLDGYQTGSMNALLDAGS